MSEFEPGTVAKATVRGVEGVTVFRAAVGEGPLWVTTVAVDEWTLHRDPCVTDVRPLVVLDLEDPAETVRHLRATISPWDVIEDIADAIEAQTRPPKPAEPTGLGAVVADAHGEWWVRDKTTTTVKHWKRARGEDGGRRHLYADIDAVRVLSPGVEP